MKLALSWSVAKIRPMYVIKRERTAEIWSFAYFLMVRIIFNFESPSIV